MIKRTLVTLFILCCSMILFSQEKPLVKGMKITKSVKIKKGHYFLNTADPENPVILIEGDNIVVDFNQAIVNGSKTPGMPDQFTGVCILIRNSKKVTIRNLNARGYKIALRAMNVDDLVLEKCDLSYNYRKNLNSTQEKEDISDWMSYHQNEKDEWLRYGAAIYLRNCQGALVRNCRVTGGQNALMMTECNDAMIYNNDFSFNSAIGLGMYRCNRNKVMYNRMNFNVRGYSHGVYRRGQDSAGILVYEQSSNNLFYQNSVTHSGDGFFLWAGQTTMETGEGGCNDNILWGNDFSYAPTNGIEVTFSRNIILNNRIFDCDHGIWGGYSYGSLIRNNQFRDNRIAIAIEHGQDNRILYNLFSQDREAIRLWARKEQPADWGYAKHRDTRSRDYVIAYNSFNKNPLVYNIKMTRGLQILENTISGAELDYKIDSTVSGLDSIGNDEIREKILTDTFKLVVPTVPKPRDPFAGNGKLKGRQNMMITEWGPYDFSYPIIWNTNPVDSGMQMKFSILGPAGKWKLKTVKGVSNISSVNGSFPATITALKTSSDRSDILIELEYTGPAFTSAFGEMIPANRKHIFSYRYFFQPIDWSVAWYAMDTAIHNPLSTGELFSPVERKVPVKTEKSTKLDYAWWGGIRGQEDTYRQFFTIADGEAVFEPGEYELSVTWDDAVRVYIDGQMMVDEWNPALYKFDESPNRKLRLKLGGKHVFRVEHLELGGFACLSLKFKRLP